MKTDAAEKTTVATRLEIGFLPRGEWCAAPAHYDELSLRIAGHPVMEAWETEYMGHLADIATAAGGTVLEVGYGMGLSAKRIQTEPSVERHLVVECHPQVIERALEDQAVAISARRFSVLSGFWQDVTPLLAPGSFDAILFDTYPMSEQEIHRNHFDFFPEAWRLLKPGGLLTYYSDEATDLSDDHLHALHSAGFSDIEFEVCPVQPPPDCEYWREPTLVAPRIRKAA